MIIKTTNNTKYIKGTALSLIAATFLLSGCGSSGIDDVYDRGFGEDTTQTDYSVQVVDDAVKGSKVMANECTGFEEKGDGWYTLTGCSTRPKAIIADGGYITLNVDGNDTNVSMGFPLMINTNMIEQSSSYTATPLTTLLATVNDYNELKALQDKLGFASIQDMFKDDNTTRDLQRTLNTYFLEAQNNGVDINNFADFTADFRSMLKQASGNNPTDMIKDAKGKLKEDFDKNRDKYMSKYGVVFSGFVTSTDYTGEGGTSALLTNIGNKFRGDEHQIVFSGFIFDDVIGSSNANYDENATITIQNLNTNEFLPLDDNNATSLKANEYGQYTLKIDQAKIIQDNSYMLKGTITNKQNRDIELKSILTGDELLAKFKQNLNTSDVPDLTISNVTTAKVAILEKKGVDLNDTTDVVAKKKEIEQEKSTLLNVATGIKTIIDGNVTIGESNNTYDYIKTTITTEGLFEKPVAMNTTFDSFKTIITSNKTLVSQLTSTKYEKFKIDSNLVTGKRIVITVAGELYPTTIQLFSNGSYTLESKDNALNPIFNVGKWKIDTNGDLELKNIEDDSISVLALDKLTLAQATYNAAGQFTGTTSNPKGTFKQGSLPSNLVELTTLVNIDLTKFSPPMIEFTTDNIKNKKLYEVYYDSTSNEYKDAVYIFDANGTNAYYTEDVKDETGKVQRNVLISDGILTVGTDIFKIKKAYPTKIVVSTNRNTSSSSLGEEVEELFYSPINAAAAAQIKTYDNSTHKISKFASNDWGIDPANNNNSSYNVATISTTPFEIKAVPLANDPLNYQQSYVNIDSTRFDSNITIGTKTQLAITENLGDSARQRAKTSTRYLLPNFDPTASAGQLLVDVQIRYNKVVYNLKVRDASGVDHNILDIPVTILEENTLNKKYDVMTVLLENQVAIRVSDGLSSYYQYIDLENLWSSKPNDLKYFSYPTALIKSVNTAYLDDDGTGTLYKGRMNTPVTLKVYDFAIINGKNTATSNYDGGSSPICTVKDKDTTPDNFGFTPVNLADFNSSYESNSITISGVNAPTPLGITGGQYSLDGGTNWETISTTISSGQSVKVKINSSTASNTTTSATLTIGGIARTFSVTTKDIRPDNFSFASKTNVELNTTVDSDSFTISGINADAPISIVGGMYSINNGTWTESNGTINIGDNVKIRLNSSNSYTTSASATLNIGGITATFSATTKAAPVVDNSSIITNYATQIFSNNNGTYFETWGATPTISEYNLLAGTNVSFLSESFGDVWYERGNDWQEFGTSTNSVYQLPTSSSIAGAISFSEKKIKQNLINNQWTTIDVIETNESRRLDYVSTGVYKFYSENNATAQEEIKFVKEFSGTELNTYFSSPLAITFDTTNDKAAMMLTKALNTYYEWNEIEKYWATNNTFASLDEFIAQYKGDGYFTSSNITENTGIAFSSDSNITLGSGTLVEMNYSTNPQSSRNAGTWNIVDGILDINITIDGYDYIPAFTLKDNVVWRGDKRLKDSLNAGLLFNQSALEKLKTKIQVPLIPLFTASMVSGKTIYEVYFDTEGEYDTNASKSIARFTFDGNGSTTSGSFTAIALYGNDVNSTGGGTWAITLDGRLETKFDNDIIGYNTIQSILTNPNGIRTSWVDANQADINYYFYYLTDANNFGYETNATESSSAPTYFSIPEGTYPESTEVANIFNISTVADVNDAKTMVANLRELAYSMYKQEDNGTESGLLVTQDDLHMNHIKSVVDNFDISINTTADAITTLADTFSNKVETDLNSTILAIETRLNNIATQINTQLESNTTSISVIDGGQTFNMSVDYDSNGTVVSAQTQNVTMSGTGYSLLIRSMNYDYDSTLMKHALQMMGDANITAGDTTFIGNINIDGIIDDQAPDDFTPIDKLLFSFNGRVVSAGRILDGNLSIDTDNGNYKLHGKLAGLTGEPNIEGDFLASITLQNLQKINVDHEVDWAYTYNVGDYYNSGYYYPVLAKDNNNIYHLIKDGSTLTTLDTNTSLAGTNNIGVYTPENYNFMVSVIVNETTYNGYLQSFYNSNGHLSYGIETNDDQWVDVQINTLMDSNLTVTVWDNYTKITETTLPISALTITPEIKVDLEDIPQSYMFDGNITHTTGDLTNIANLKIAINKPTESKTANAVIQNLTFGNEKVQLQAANITLGKVFLDGNTTISETETNSFSLSGLRGTVLDDSNITLSLDINGTGSSKTYRTLDNDTPHQEDTLDMNATYSYAGTTFNGSLEFNLHDPYTDDPYYSSSLPRSTGTAKFQGMVSSTNGFAPFNLSLEANLIDAPNNERYEAMTLLLNRETTPPYSLAAKMVSKFHRVGEDIRYWQKDGTILDIKDINGVSGNSYATGEYSIDSIVFKNTSSTTLGTAGEQTTGNNWEILYSDNTSETIF